MYSDALMLESSAFPLAALERSLRSLLPADLYVEAWFNPSAATLTRVFEHLRALHYTLRGYVPRQVLDSSPKPGEVRYEWQEGTLLFTDLVGFTPLVEAGLARGDAGAEALRELLNRYFAQMLDIVGKSGGNLLEFTGDALLVEFRADKRRNDTIQAVRAGLRMQRAMAQFAALVMRGETVSLTMRVGIHTGRFLTAEIGTPRRMEHVLLGQVVQDAKGAEAAGTVGRVCLTQTTRDRAGEDFRFEAGEAGYQFVVDDLTDEQLGEYDIVLPRRRLPTTLLLDRTPEGLVGEISKAIEQVESLSSYLPQAILTLLVENAASRPISPAFYESTVMFVHLIGLPEAVALASTGEVAEIVAGFSHIFAAIDAIVESRGGIVHKVTDHLNGSDILIYFGIPQTQGQEACRAAEAALAIRDAISFATEQGSIAHLHPPLSLTCQIGIACGAVFATTSTSLSTSKVGEPRGRWEFNVLGDAVNTAARLMVQAESNQILITQAVYDAIAPHFSCLPFESAQGRPLGAGSHPVAVLEGQGSRG